MTSLWQGTPQQRLRLSSGLVLFVFAIFHFLNIGAGIISTQAMDEMQDLRLAITGSLPGQVILFGALLSHASLALWQLASRRTLRMRPLQALQLALGLLIPLQLVQHVVYTTYADRMLDMNKEMSAVILLMWNSPEVWQQYFLLLAVWTHGCIGIHIWLRQLSWWRAYLPVLSAAAVLLPAFALAGLVTEGRRIFDLYTNQGQALALRAQFNWPEFEGFAHLKQVYEISTISFFALTGAALLIFGLRRLQRQRSSVRIRYVDGPEVTAERGLSLLEISQQKGIPHPSLCGGKGRCTTCRVAILAGAESLPAPSPSEARSLRASKVGPEVRLACQIHPTAPLTVKRVYQPKGRRRVHSAQGEEKTIAVLFLDIRGFTSRSAGLLPYDVVFLLNRFFDAIVPEITRYGGTVDKYMGDGLLALFETHDAASSALAALRATGAIGVALARFNRMLQAEGDDPVRIGMGLHLGTVVLGEIGAADNAPRTLIGATVNAASRLEAKTKDLGVELLISRAVFDAAGVDIGAESYDAYELRGVARPVSAMAVQRASAVETILARD